MQCWSTFPVNSLLVDRAKPYLCQNYATLSDDLLSDIERNKHRKVIVNFPRKYLLGEMDNLGQI